MVLSLAVILSHFNVKTNAEVLLASLGWELGLLKAHRGAPDESKQLAA